MVPEIIAEAPSDETIDSDLEPVLSARLADDAAGPDALAFSVRRISDGTEVASGTGSLADPGDLSTWQVGPNALDPNQDYYWYAESADGGRSDDSRYITTSSGPQVAMLTPFDGSSIGGTIPLRAAAVGFDSIDRIEFLVDGSEVGEVTAIPYEFEWDVPLPSGSHEIEAVAHGVVSGQPATATSPAITVSFSEGDLLTSPFGENISDDDPEEYLPEPVDLTEPTPVDSYVVSESTNPDLSVTNTEKVNVRKWRIRQYAYQWWNGANPRYYRFPANDCTNFVSQALRYGGWRFSELNGDFGDNRNWFYHRPLGSYHERSLTWMLTQRFMRFANWSGRGRWLTNLWQVQVGDIVFFDWRGPNVGGVNPSHAAIVTGTPNRGLSSQNILFTYHSINRKDRPWRGTYQGKRGIVVDWPNVTVWAFRVNPTYED